MAEPHYHLDVQHEGLEALTRAIRQEEDGKELRRELAKNMRAALKPAAEKAKSGIMGMATSGKSSSSPALRPAIAKRIRPEVKLGGRWTGARVKARKTPQLRRFPNAPKRTQSTKGWRTQTFGNGAWRTQHGKREWFDQAMRPAKEPAQKAAMQAMEAMAARIAARSRRGP
jgi:hypothetical protein